MTDEKSNKNPYYLLGYAEIALEDAIKNLEIVIKTKEYIHLKLIIYGLKRDLEKIRLKPE